MTIDGLVLIGVVFTWAPEASSRRGFRQDDLPDVGLPEDVVFVLETIRARRVVSCAGCSYRPRNEIAKLVRCSRGAILVVGRGSWVVGRGSWVVGHG